MGAWGPGLYSDDITCEVRDFYVELLTLGKSDSEATKKILSRYQDVLTNREVECLVLLALADTKWNYGRLDNKTKSRAISIICQGGDIEIWKSESPKDVKKREKVLSSLLNKLSSPQPDLRNVKQKKMRPPKCQFKGPIGQILSIDLTEDLIALVKVVGFFRDSHLVTPMFQLINYCGSSVPTQAKLEAISTNTLSIEGNREFCFLHEDGRKNPISLLKDTDITVNQIEIRSKGSFVFFYIDDFPQRIKKQLTQS